DEGQSFFKSTESELVGMVFETEDNVIPSANAIMAKVIFYLGFLYDNEYFTRISNEMTERILGQIDYASAYSEWLRNNLMIKNNFEYIIVVNPTKQELDQLKKKNTFRLIIDNSLNIPILDSYKNKNKKCQVCKLISCTLRTDHINIILSLYKTIQMKKIVFIMSFGLIGFFSNAQMTLQSGDGTLTFRKSEEFNEAAVAGSRYLNEQYQNTKVNKGTQDFLIRYNAYNDVMEYKNGADVLELIKDKNTHFIFQDGTVYELFTYNLDGKSYERYHQVLVDNKNSKISKFQSIRLLPAQKATNSYESDTQATFK